MPSEGTNRTLLLTERVPRVAKIAPADVQYLLDHHRDHLCLTPTGRRHSYRLLARGVAGVVRAPTCRLVIAPKIPLPNLFFMLDPTQPLPSQSDRVVTTPASGIVDFLAGQFAWRLQERASAGLHRAYVEQTEQGSHLQGRLDLPAQLRQGPARKDQLHSRYEDLTANLPCNRLPLTVAERLLSLPYLNAEVAQGLRQALRGFDGIQPLPLEQREVQKLSEEPEPEEYRPLLELCRLLIEGLLPGEDLGPTPAPSFLLNLERVFERYLTRGVVKGFAGSRWTVQVQRSCVVNQPSPGLADLTMRPDLTIQDGSKPLLVIDAKWKRLGKKGPATTDLYQMLAYCTALGAGRAVLVYPGRHDRLWAYRLLKSPIKIELRTLRVTASPPRCHRSLARLAHRLLGSLA